MEAVLRKAKRSEFAECKTLHLQEMLYALAGAP